MLNLSISSLDILATSVFLGGALVLLAFALFSYMGLFSLRSSARRPAFYNGKHVVVTGGSSGIGKEIARELVACGASVTIVARNEKRLLETARELEPPGESQATAKRVNIASADCSDAKAVNSMVDDVETQFGPIDILINSAGAATGGYIETLDPEAFKMQMDSNYYSQVYPTQAVLKKMQMRRSGQVVFVSSLAGLAGVFGLSAYSSSKFAIRGFAEAMYFECKPFNINVTIVYPPDTDTPGYAAERSSTPPETTEIEEMGGLFSPEVVAKCALNGVMRKKYRVNIGMIGKLLGIVTSGYGPDVSIWEVMLMSLLRAVVPLFLWDQNRIIRKGHKTRFPEAGKKANN